VIIWNIFPRFGTLCQENFWQPCFCDQKKLFFQKKRLFDTKEKKFTFRDRARKEKIEEKAGSLFGPIE
jgi:hypothetical protein